MLGGLVLSTSIPKAFESRGLAFAGAYVAMQIGRTPVHALGLRPPHPPDNYRNFQRITIWFALSGDDLDRGRLAEGHARLAIWGCALLIECRDRRSPSGCRGSAARPPPTGTSMAATWRNAAGCSSSSRSANRSSSPAACSRAANWNALDRRGVRGRVRRQRGDVVDLFQCRGGARQPPDQRVEPIRDASRASPTSISTCRSSRESSSPRPAMK